MFCIYGHKAVIASRCPLLSPKLLPGAHEAMQAAKSSHLLRDVEPDIFRKIMLFVYSNCINLDGLVVNELVDIFRASQLFQLNELPDLVTGKLIMMLNNQTVFDILNAAVKLKSVKLQGAAMDHIIKYSQEILNPGNTFLHRASPRAMLAILNCDNLLVDELTLFRTAIGWADAFLTNAQESGTNFSPTTPSPRARSSLYRTDPSGYRSPSITAPQKHTRSVRRAVSLVLGAIRYSLLTPKNLREIEQDTQWKEYIPPSCLADAWRIITFKLSGSAPDESLSLPTTLPQRQATRKKL